MSGIVAANPAGRLDVLAYRLAERGAERIMPREWPALAPHVEKWAKRNLSPGKLGIAPWLIYAAGAGAATAGGSLYDSYHSGYVNNLLQYVGLKDTPEIPKSPNTLVPPAPLTAEKVKTWTPADLAEATVQRGAQYKLDTDWIRALNNNSNSSSGEEPKEDMTWIWVALAASAVGVILLLRR